MDAKHFANWTLLFDAGCRQIRRAVSRPSAADGSAAECALAIVSNAIVMEAYANRHAQELLPDNFAQVFVKLTVPQRYKMYPRLVGRVNRDPAEWERDSIHEELKKLFSIRNKLVHGNIYKMDMKACEPSTAARLWNASLDGIIKLETLWLDRIPPSRHNDFKQEVRAYKVASQ